jgi:glycosyltransferase involved in cell wall biosynthesis
MKISVIIAIYKDTQSLDLILQSLTNQTYEENFEIVIAEDGENSEVKAFLDALSYKNILHTTQEDLSWRKNESLNNAIKNSTGELLIFLDGDCIPYSNLVENYALNASKKTVLCGRRVELGESYSKNLRDKSISIQEIENSYLKHYLNMRKDKTRHYEEGIKLNTFFYKLKYRNKASHILGCNFALNRKDILDINGFNEDYKTASVGEDTDIEYRLKLNDCVMKPTRNLTNVVHLYHKITYDQVANNNSSLVFNEVKKKQEIYCKNGIKKEKDN